MSEEMIERYLLGQLTADQQERIEARLFEGDELFRTLEDVEEHLIDRYLAGELSARDRDAFEKHFAASRYRRDRVAFRSKLPDALAAYASRHGVPPPDRAEDRESRRNYRSILVAAATGLAAVLVVTLGWFLAPRAPMLSPAPSPSPASRPAPGQAPVDTSQPAAVSPPASPSASLVLRSGLQRASGVMPRLAAPGAGEVRLEAPLDAPAEAGQARAVLRRAEGETVWEGSAAIAPSGRTAWVIVPAPLLSPGDYILMVSPRGTTLGDAPAYAFRVVPGPPRN